MKRITRFVCSASVPALLAVAFPAHAEEVMGAQPVTAASAADAEAQPADAQAPITAPAPAVAQGQQGEIVVTGSRLREESVQETPIAVSVVNNRVLQDLHATDITSLTAIAPSLNISFNPTGNSVPLISLRGFVVVTTEISAEPGVSIYLDGIYQPTISGSLSNLFDVDRIEVLRGPQSALLGKSSSAGAILIRRMRPSNHFDARIETEYGTDNLLQTQARVTFPIVDGILSGHVYGLFRHRDDYVNNSFPGGRDVGGESNGELRGALRFTPTDKIDWYVTAEYNESHPSQAPVRNIAPATYLSCTLYHLCTNDAGLRRVDNTDDSLRSRQKDWSITSELNIEAGGARITSLTGYRKFDYVNNSDVDGTPFPLLNVFNQTTDSTVTSQEVRLSSIENGGWDFGGRLAWLIGAYYNHGNILLVEPHQQYGGSAIPVNNVAGQRSIRTGYAVFGHLDFDVTSALTLSVGARQSWDHVHHLFSLRTAGFTVPDPLPNSQERSDRNFSMEAGAQYKISDTAMVYVRYAEGYRGGGFIGLPGTLAQSVGGYGPETSASYEVGLRSELFDRKLQFNLTLYNTNFHDLQRSETVPSPTAGFIVITGNIASARTRGIEAEVVARPTQGLNIRAAIAYLDPQYTDYVSGGVDLSNTRFSFSPHWTINITPSYEFRISDNGLFDTVRLQGQYAYRSTFLSAAQDIPEFTQKAYSVVDGSITLTGGSHARYSLGVYVQNLFDQDYITYGTVAAPLFRIIFDNPGRRFGVTAAVNF